MEESLQFEWDDKKNKVNVSAHGISFDAAKYVWSDPFRLIRYDYVHSDSEDRYQILGKVGKVLFVVFTENKENNSIIRIISARVATQTERKAYYGKDTKCSKNWRPA